MPLVAKAHRPQQAWAASPKLETGPLRQEAAKAHRPQRAWAASRKLETGWLEARKRLNPLFLRTSWEASKGRA
ncbi:hypothetical protein DB31_0337 [Hyalangium minutum]|uniref:Uncharacterized protein n=1 Tax=Hyalangium minutum TaxID=394096 RepID=A0A085WWL3_9BACT|nr:hypothetical protein DB31_0337 [Hyalangium minutum]